VSLKKKTLNTNLEPTGLPIMVTQLDKRHANRTVRSVLKWCERHRANGSYERRRTDYMVCISSYFCL